jgi:hypothetical protein
MSDPDLIALVDHLEYWPGVGQFTWRKSPGRRVQPNSPAGHRTVGGVLVITFRGKKYKVDDLLQLPRLAPLPCHQASGH